MTKSQKARLAEMAEAYVTVDPPYEGMSVDILCLLTPPIGPRLWEVFAWHAGRKAVLATYPEQDEATARAAAKYLESQLIKQYTAAMQA